MLRCNRLQAKAAGGGRHFHHQKFTELRQDQQLTLAGPTHDQVAAQVTAHITSLLDQIFAASRDALAIGIEHAFVGALVISGFILVVSCFLKNVPFSQQMKGASEVPASSWLKG